MAQVFKCPFGLSFAYFAAKYAASDPILFVEIKKR